jgi:enterochelin esterase family protein
MFVSRLALPLAQGHLRLIDIEQQPGAYGVLGASMGGLMALHTGLRLPSIFGHVISQSGAFQFMPLDTVEPLPHTLIKALAPQISDRLRIWQDVGTMEWLLDSNRATHTLLKDQGYDVIYREFHTGHNYPAWRNILPEALTALYGVGG